MPGIVAGGSGFGGRGTPGILPNVNSLYGGGGYGGGGLGAMVSSLAAPWKKRLQGSAPLPGGGGSPGGGGGTPSGGGIPEGGGLGIAAGRPLPPMIGIRQPPGLRSREGREGGPPNLDPNFNIYEQYPGFNPLTWHGDDLDGLDRLRGAKPDQLQTLSNAAQRLRGYSPMQRNVSGIGFGLSDPMGQFRKLLQARMGGV